MRIPYGYKNNQQSQLKDNYWKIEGFKRLLGIIFRSKLVTGTHLLLSLPTMGQLREMNSLLSCIFQINFKLRTLAKFTVEKDLPTCIFNNFFYKV